MKTERSLRVCAVVALTVILQSCASVAPRNAVPEELVEEASVPPGMQARMWGDAAPENFDELVEIFRQQLVRDGGEEALAIPRSMLLISGGGANGAFGAGLLKGWTESGTRPEMTIVTGISTGALIAPYAFLGSDYDDELETLYTTLYTKDIVKQRPLLSGLRGDALADTQPLRELLQTYVDNQMIARIAQEHERGRRLLIGTTNLDAKRPVIWNIGAIAAEGTKESAQLIRDVMLASASIPGLFPPVRINVRVGDRVYDELHVDGGVASQVFLYPAQVDLRESARTVGAEGRITMYVIRNSILAPRWSEVKPKLGPVALTSISTLIRTQGMGDLYRLYLGAKRDRISFRLAYIPETFNLEPEEEFDPVYMRGLFDLGYNMARDGYEWERSPPGVALP
ncbi:MAG: patatin-like phospholipase family protein [Betaproteobacteria bacterium]|nr:MAG: patatin-like phospholipase family protein [Betaproteobacteria bacterium]